MIAILCPTRARPQQLDRLNKSKGSLARMYVCYSDWPRDLGEFVDFHYVCKVNENTPTVAKWEYLAQTAMATPETKLFMLGADDMIFETEGWDKALIDHYNGQENKIHVYALQDSRDKNGTPHIIVTREYIDALGYFIPPIFLHWYVDSWTVEIARANGCFTHLAAYSLRHDKPSDSGNADETHSRIRQWGWHERDKYVADKMAHILEGEKKRLADALRGKVS